ncbi:MAG: transcriptional regulator [Kiritimatiellae bacterium]|nr:transcriptional regulator [Kiritimatiellia bacterium]
MDTDEVLDEIVGVMASLKDPVELRSFLEDLFTPSELCDLALRWRLVERLAAGESQRKIAGELGISLCKITRGSRILKQNGIVSRELAKRKGKRESE